MKLVSLLLSLMSMHTFASTTAYFADSCSGEETKISTPNGVVLKVDLKEINPNDELRIWIKFRPAGPISDMRDKDQVVTKKFLIKREKYLDGNYTGRFSLPDQKWMWQKEQENEFYRIWDAEVLWFQKGVNKSGTDIASFYRAPEKKSFFQITGAGTCQWENEPTIDSKLYENNSQTFMNVVRESEQLWDQYKMSGFSLGYNRNHGGVIPLNANSEALYGWFFKDWQKQVNTQTIIRNERRYVLNKEEAGFFTSRMSFNRHMAKKYKWVAGAGQCGKYKQVSEGYLDVGVPVEDFIVIPRYLYPRDQEIKDFINAVRPSVDNCKKSIRLEPQMATEHLPSGITGLLYYYELNRSF